MRIIVILCILVIDASGAPMLNDQASDEWELFKSVHRKQYATSEEENIR